MDFYFFLVNFKSKFSRPNFTELNCSTRFVMRNVLQEPSTLFPPPTADYFGIYFFYL